MYTVDIELDVSSSITYSTYLLGEALLGFRSPGSGEEREGLGAGPEPGLGPRVEPLGEFQTTG